MCTICEQNKGIKLTSKDFVNKGGSFKKMCEDEMYLHNIATKIPFTQYLKIWLSHFTQDKNGNWHAPRYVTADHDLHKFVQMPQTMYSPPSPVIYEETNLSSDLLVTNYENDNVSFDVTQFS